MLVIHANDCVLVQLPHELLFTVQFRFSFLYVFGAVHISVLGLKNIPFLLLGFVCTIFILFYQTIFMLISLLELFFFSVLAGEQSEFVNVLVQGEFVYCHPCGGYIGRIEGGLIVVRHARFVRIDPRYLLSYCVGRYRGDDGVIIQHRHIAHMATVVSRITSPIAPVELISYRNGRRLDVRCPFANYFRARPTESHTANQFHAQETIDQPIDLSMPTSNNPIENPVPTPSASIDLTTNTTTGATTPVIEISPNRSLEENLDRFINQQPSTSSGRYSHHVQRVVDARQVFCPDPSSGPGMKRRKIDNRDVSVLTSFYF